MPEFCPTCPTQTIVDPPQTIFEDYFHPQVVQVIHPIEVVRRHHCVPVPQHICTYTERDEMCFVSSVKKRKKRK
ncbi:hypothetical protein J2T12_001774 [Paenibacillus anaericanus]|uniref:Uncharacterized protein n=1 Tax=Paenibacillus anaericanus TaxID=170367 RepID=A0A433YDF5_9BACL|nr:hypothetical protein [Paenibacillus anaericanus]MDQ0088368.1 hypothetical protein [Paenibacillus anaericanus]RUT47898.1 hypothetical protein EJP82_05845 [Paenibacillus anaericanus]